MQGTFSLVSLTSANLPYCEEVCCLCNGELGNWGYSRPRASGGKLRQALDRAFLRSTLTRAQVRVRSTSRRREATGCGKPEDRKPMAPNPALSISSRSVLVGGLLLAAAGCAAPPPSTQVPVPPGQARLWFYRDWQPSESLDLANIDVNGAYFGSVANGAAFYRDVPPGTYHIAPVSFARDFNQDATVALVPGQQAFIKILSLTSWATSVSVSRDFQRDAFYAWVIPPQAAKAEIARDRRGL
jgi:hypothetical protein